MSNQRKFTVSHAPFWHNGSKISERSYHTIFAALPAVLFGVFQYGAPALAVVALSMGSAIFWELAFTRLARRPDTIGDGNAALIGLIFAMLLPAATPWWVVITGTFFAVIIGKQIYGGIGGNPFNPAVLAMAILMISWKRYFDFDTALVAYDFNFDMRYPLAALKFFGVSSVWSFNAADLLMGKQIGGIGSTFGLGLILGGIYLMIRGFIRWEIVISFIVGVLLTSLIFQQAAPDTYAGPAIHLFSGYTLIAAFFLVPEDSSSPVNFVPMIIYGLAGGLMTVLIRNQGAYVDGVIFAVLIINLINPLLDKIRPKALGRVG